MDRLPASESQDRAALARVGSAEDAPDAVNLQIGEAAISHLEIALLAAAQVEQVLLCLLASERRWTPSG